MDDQKPQDEDTPTGAAFELSAGLAMITVSVQPSTAPGSGGGGGINSRLIWWSRKDGLLEQIRHEHDPFCGWDEECEPAEAKMTDLKKRTLFDRRDIPSRIKYGLRSLWALPKRLWLHADTALRCLGDKFLKL